MKQEAGSYSRDGAMIEKLEMTVLIDNLAEAPLVGEWDSA